MINLKKGTLKYETGLSNFILYPWTDPSTYGTRYLTKSDINNLKITLDKELKRDTIKKRCGIWIPIAIIVAIFISYFLFCMYAFNKYGDTSAYHNITAYVRLPTIIIFPICTSFLCITSSDRNLNLEYKLKQFKKNYGKYFKLNKLWQKVKV